MAAPSHRQMTGYAQMPTAHLDKKRIAFGSPYREEMTDRPDGDANQPETKAEADGPGQRTVHNSDGARCAAEQDMLGQRPMDRHGKAGNGIKALETARHQSSAPPPTMAAHGRDAAVIVSDCVIANGTADSELPSGR